MFLLKIYQLYSSLYEQVLLDKKVDNGDFRKSEVLEKIDDSSSDSSSSKRTTRSTKRTSSNKPEALTDAMRLLGLGTSMGISPSHPLEAEEESIDIRDDTGDDADGVESSYYSSSSGYKLRL